MDTTPHTEPGLPAQERVAGRPAPSVATAPPGSSGLSLLLVRVAPWLLVGGLLLFHAINNWIWLQDNVTWTGWDKARHLARSLAYDQMLSPITLRSLFDVAVSDPVRTPLFPASAAIMYKLFGYTEDVATMVNVLYMAVALAATYGIGRRWGRERGRVLGLIAATLLALFPMFYSMSRYFYIEFATTAMAALTVYLLLATDGFRRRGASLLFGLGLGLGLLTKRTFGVFAAGPVLVAVLTSGALPELWRRLRRRPRIHVRSAALALVGGLVLSALWYLPNREAVRGLILGDWLFVIWWLLAALTIYFASLPSAPLANGLAACFLAAGLASTWYLARIEFLKRVALYGYGIDDPRGRTLRLDDLNTYLYYVRKLGNEHLSLVLFVLLAAVLLVALVLYVRRQGSLLRAARRIRPEAWIVLAWAGGGYLLLTLSIYQETRALTPALPGVALLAAAALLKLPGRGLRAGLLALILAWGLVQFFAVSYEAAYRVLTPAVVQVPGWGRTTTLAQGVYIQLPDEGRTDRGYWIQPDILQRMETERQAQGQEMLSLGLLLNTSQINAGAFNYLILTQYPQLRVESLIERFEAESPYRRLFAHRYVATKRINAGMNPVQKELILDLLGETPPALFVQHYELETSYVLPDGDTAYLYRARYPLPVDYPAEYVTGLAQNLAGRTREGDAILVTAPALVAPFVAAYEGPAEIYGAAGDAGELAAIAAAHRRLVVVIGDAAAGPVQGLGESWLNDNAFRASHEWAGSLQAVLYGTVASEPAAEPSTPAAAGFGDAVSLQGYDLPAGPWQPGDVVPLTLFWQSRPLPRTPSAGTGASSAGGQPGLAANYQVFVHLLDDSGTLVAQNDSAPAGGSRPTGTWAVGETVVDRRGLLLPADLPPGEYRLRVGMYVPAGGERLLVVAGPGAAPEDALDLGSLLVGP